MMKKRFIVFGVIAILAVVLTFLFTVNSLKKVYAESGIVLNQ